MRLSWSSQRSPQSVCADQPCLVLLWRSLLLLSSARERLSSSLDIQVVVTPAVMYTALTRRAVLFWLTHANTQDEGRTDYARLPLSARDGGTFRITSDVPTDTSLQMSSLPVYSLSELFSPGRALLAWFDSTQEKRRGEREMEMLLSLTLLLNPSAVPGPINAMQRPFAPRSRWK